MYAIAFDLDTAILRNAYRNPSWENAYSDIRGHLQNAGFTWKQGSVYFGDDSVDAVKCVLVVQELCAAFDWFRSAVRDIRMLRIEEYNDLMPAIERYEVLARNNPELLAERPAAYAPSQIHATTHSH